MSTYIILVNFTSEGIKGIKDLAQRWKGLEDRLTRVGGRLVKSPDTSFDAARHREEFSVRRGQLKDIYC